MDHLRLDPPFGNLRKQHSAYTPGYHPNSGVLPRDTRGGAASRRAVPVSTGRFCRNNVAVRPLPSPSLIPQVPRIGRAPFLLALVTVLHPPPPFPYFSFLFEIRAIALIAANIGFSPRLPSTERDNSIFYPGFFFHLPYFPRFFLFPTFLLSTTPPSIFDILPVFITRHCERDATCLNGNSGALFKWIPKREMWIYSIRKDCYPNVVTSKG